MVEPLFRLSCLQVPVDQAVNTAVHVAAELMFQLSCLQLPVDQAVVLAVYVAVELLFPLAQVLLASEEESYSKNFPVSICSLCCI